MGDRNTKEIIKVHEVIESAKILQKYCKERDCTECIFAKSNGDCSICYLPDCWKIPNRGGQVNG